MGYVEGTHLFVKSLKSTFLARHDQSLLIGILLSGMFAACALGEAQKINPYEECEWITVCEFRHAEDGRDFRQVQLLIGPTAAAPFRIVHQRSDKFKDRSLWIVFMRYAAPTHGEFKPLDGDEGIKPFTWENFISTLDGIEKYRQLKYNRPAAQKEFERLEDGERCSTFLYENL